MKISRMLRVAIVEAGSRRTKIDLSPMLDVSFFNHIQTGTATVSNLPGRRRAYTAKRFTTASINAESTYNWKASQWSVPESGT